MNLEKNYQLTEVLRDDGVRTVRAREIVGGRLLQVHFFNVPGEQALFDQLRGLPLSARRDLLETGYEGQTPYIVTDPLPENTTARAWFTALVKPPEVKRHDGVKAGIWKVGTPMPEPLFPETPPSAAPAVGEFTQMFHAPTVKAPDPAPTPQAAAPGAFTQMFQAPPAAPEAPPPPAKPAPGEFTRMFQAPSVPAPSVPEVDQFAQMFQKAAAVPEAPVATPPAKPAPGEFTQMFQAPSVPAPAPPMPAPTPLAPAKAAPGEFTQMFQAAPPPAPPVAPAGEVNQATRLFQSPVTPTAPPPPPPQQQGASEFTRFFQSPLQPQALKENRPLTDPFTAPPPPPPAPKRPGEFTQTFGNPARPPAAAPPLGASATGAFAVQAPPPVRSSGARGPGEFTQMMSGGSAPTLGQAPASQPPAAGKPASSKLPLMLILGAALLFAILLVVFFALRHA